MPLCPERPLRNRDFFQECDGGHGQWPLGRSPEIGGALAPGNDGDHLPSGEWVIRVAKTSKYGYAAHQSNFELSTKDKEAPIPRLSIWAERLTADEQAWRLTGSKRDNDAMPRLNVDLIRSLVPEPSNPPAPHLEAEWEPRFVENEHGTRVLDPQPGSAGHAGIRHLWDGDRAQRTSLRVQLAENAEVRRLPELLLGEGAVPINQ